MLALIAIILYFIAIADGSANYDSGKPNPLEILGLDPPFYQFWSYSPPSDSDVKKAYRKKSLMLHPDKNNNVKATKEFVLLTEAYNLLKGTSKEAQLRREKVSAIYDDHGTTLRSCLNTVESACVYPYIEIMRIYSVYKRLLIREMKIFFKQPFRTLHSYWRIIAGLTVQQLLWLAFKGWLLYELLGFICFLIKKYLFRRSFFAFKRVRSNHYPPSTMGRPARGKFRANARVWAIEPEVYQRNMHERDRKTDQSNDTKMYSTGYGKLSAKFASSNPGSRTRTGSAGTDNNTAKGNKDNINSDNLYRSNNSNAENSDTSDSVLYI